MARPLMRVVIPSLHYGDFLGATLPAWRALLPAADIVVVTSPRDPESAVIAREYGARPLVTDAWTRRGAALNKGAALDAGFDGLAAGDLCLSIDADVYPCGRFPRAEKVAEDTIYGCPRYQVTTPAAIEDHLAGRLTREALPLIGPRAGGEPQLGGATTPKEAAARCLGYFQLFRYSPRRRFGDSRSAGKCDITFRNQFRRRRGITRFYVLHLGELSRRNWKGRVVPAWGAA